MRRRKKRLRKKGVKMETRKEFASRLMACVAAGTLANFSMLAAGQGNPDRLGDKKDGCNGSSSMMPDVCRGKGAKSDGCTGGKFGNDTNPPPPACKARASDHAE